MKIREKYCISVSGGSEETMKKHCSLASVTIFLQLFNAELPVIWYFHVQNSMYIYIILNDTKIIICRAMKCVPWPWAWDLWRREEPEKISQLKKSTAFWKESKKWATTGIWFCGLTLSRKDGQVLTFPRSTTGYRWRYSSLNFLLLANAVSPLFIVSPWAAEIKTGFQSVQPWDFALCQCSAHENGLWCNSIKASAWRERIKGGKDQKALEPPTATWWGTEGMRVSLRTELFPVFTRKLLSSLLSLCCDAGQWERPCSGFPVVHPSIPPTGSIAPVLWRPWEQLSGKPLSAGL